MQTKIGLKGKNNLIKNDKEELFLLRKIIFAKDCMRELIEDGFPDEKTVKIKQQVEDIINKSADYINRINEGARGVIVDKEHEVFVKFYVIDSTVLISEIREGVCIL